MKLKDAFTRIACDSSLTLEPKNVLLYLYGCLDFNCYRHLSQTKIADNLKIHRSHVSRAIKLLVDKDIVLVGEKIGVMKTYCLNSNYLLCEESEINSEPPTISAGLIAKLERLQRARASARKPKIAGTG